MRMAFVFFLFAGGWRLAICHFCQHRVLIVTNKLRSKICCAWLNLSFPCHREHSVTVYTTQHTLQLHSPILMDGRLCDLDFGPSTVDAVCILLLLLLFLLVFFLARLCAFMANRFHSPLCTYVCGLLKRSEFVAFVVLKMIWCRLTVAAALFQHYIFTLVRSLHSNSVIYTIFFSLVQLIRSYRLHWVCFVWLSFFASLIFRRCCFKHTDMRYIFTATTIFTSFSVCVECCVIKCHTTQSADQSWVD